MTCELAKTDQENLKQREVNKAKRKEVVEAKSQSKTTFEPLKDEPSGVKFNDEVEGMFFSRIYHGKTSFFWQIVNFEMVHYPLLQSIVEQF